MVKATQAPPAARQRRANGDESRQRILEAAAEIAGERGYEGTSIALVSERSGLPASSIYWHFEDKDKLIAAVIEASFGRWLDAMTAGAPPAGDMTKDDLFAAALRRTGRALAESGDFLRLGLMLALERRPAELSARAMFLAARQETYKRMVASYRHTFGDTLSRGDIRRLATLTMALADGLFIAHEADGVGLDDAFDAVPAAILGAAEHLRRRHQISRKP